MSLQAVPPLSCTQGLAGAHAAASLTSHHPGTGATLCPSRHYAPLATRLAQAGVITAVMQYTLYPDALVPQMVAEAS